MAAAVTIVEAVVYKDTRVVVPAEGTPAVVVITPVPVHPGRAPGTMGHPIPAQAEPPTPATVMIDGPAPGLIGDPGPAARGIPIPISVMVGPPVSIRMHVRHPDIAVGSLIGPIAVARKLALVVIKLGGQIPLGDGLGLDGVPALVPGVEIVPPEGEVRPGSELTVRGPGLSPAP